MACACMNPKGYADCATHGCLCADRKVRMPWCIPSEKEIASGEATRNYRLAMKLKAEVNSTR